MNDRIEADWLEWPQTQRLVEVFDTEFDSLRFVGGAVRDSLLGRAVSDVDVATTLMPEQVIALLEKYGIQAIPTGIKHGTVTAVIDGKHFEITTLRKDTSCDGRHAEVKFTRDWKEDARRRDFTMNALYLSPEGKIFDYVGGVQDALSGIIRFIGDPQDRIREDYLRILRFFRFHAWYGKEPIDKAALDACVQYAKWVGGLSGERVHHELLRLIAAPGAGKTLELMSELLPPALGFSVKNNDMIVRLQLVENVTGLSLENALRLAVFLLHSDVRPQDALNKMTDRLKFSNHLHDVLKVLITYVDTVYPDMRLKAQKVLLRKLGAKGFENLLLIVWAYGAEDINTAHPYNEMLTLAARWVPPVFPIGGDDLKAMGLAPGKAMGNVLKLLEAAWEDADYTLSKEELLSRLN